MGSSQITTEEKFEFHNKFVYKHIKEKQMFKREKKIKEKWKIVPYRERSSLYLLLCKRGNIGIIFNYEFGEEQQRN